MWIKHLWILFWFQWGTRRSWTRAVLSASQGGAAFPALLGSFVPPFPSPSHPKRHVSQTPCLGQKQGGLVLEVEWRWGVEGGMQRKEVQHVSRGGHPKAREGEAEGGGHRAAAGVDHPAQISAWGSGPPWAKTAKNILGLFSNNILLLFIYLLSLYWPNLILQPHLIYFEICYTL